MGKKHASQYANFGWLLDTAIFYFKSNYPILSGMLI